MQKSQNNVAKKVFGDSQVDTDIDPSMGGEDFSYLLEKKSQHVKGK